MNAISKQLAEAIASMADENKPKADWTKIDTQIAFDGKKIVLPADPAHMDYDIAIDTIERVRDQENQEFDVSELVAGAPWDTLVAVYRAMQDIYGVVMAQSRMTFFGEIKPDFVTVVTGPKSEDRIQVPMGMMTLPGVKEPINVSIEHAGTNISGTVRRRDRAILVEIANRAREIIRSNSVYKGKAIRLNVDNDGDIGLSEQPEFLDLAMVREGDIIHTAETEALIRTNVFAPLKYTDACRKNKVPLKRGILLEGKYGTGKSLTARVTAKIATDNGWTFIMLNRSQGLKAAIEFARNYQPCVIFAEDIDRSADRSDENVNDLVNLLDGMISKTMEMMVILTTNHIENIDKALLRPGRFDAVISIDAPDAETAQRIIRAYAGNLLGENADLASVGEATAGMIPASIREVVERAKLSMLTEGRTGLTAGDLQVSAIGMKRHMALLAPKPADKSASERFAESLTELMADAVAANDDAATGDEVRQASDAVIARVMKNDGIIRRTYDYAAASANSAQETLNEVRKTKAAK